MDVLIQRAKELANKQVIPYIPIQNRVAYVVSHGQSYASNGYAIRTQGIAKALNGHGLETLCFVRQGRPWDLAFADKIDFEVKVDGVRYFHSPWPEKNPSNEIIQLEIAVARFIELFSIYKPVLVLAASNYIVGLPAWVAAKQLGIPFYNEVRGFWELSRDAREPGYAATDDFEKEASRDTFVAKQALKVFTLNQPMKAELVKRGVTENVIDLVPNGVSKLPELTPAKSELKTKLGIADTDKVIGYIGSINSYEGLDTLIFACQLLFDRGVPLKLIIVGDNQPLTGVTKSFLKFEDKAWLIRVGRVPHEQVSDYYSLVDTIVIPRAKLAVCELVPPLKAVEALSYGKQLIVSDVKALNEYGKSFQGVITFKADSVDALIEALLCNWERNINSGKFSVSNVLASNDTFRDSLLFSVATNKLALKIKSERAVTNRKLTILHDGFCLDDVINESPDKFSNKKSISRAMVFTNLGLTTIDGSSVFIANVVNVYSNVFDEVFLLSVQSIGENFSERINKLSNINVIHCGANEVREKIHSLDSLLNFNTIFVRGWGDRNVWFDERYASKITYYWPLTENPESQDFEIFSSVGLLAFQTDSLRKKTFKIMGSERESMLFPPLIGNKENSSNVNSNEPVSISYIGTLREECFSYPLLKSLINISKKYRNDVRINIAIGKVFYPDQRERREVLNLLEQLRSQDNVQVEEKVSQERCDEILRGSAISFSLWEPNIQNSLQISTKMLDCLSSGVNVICFRTELHEALLGNDYGYYISHIDELESKLISSVDSQVAARSSYINNYALSFFRMPWHILNVASTYGLQAHNNTKYAKELFSEQFDNIYGLYINDSERRKLEFLSKELSINIDLFLGVNGRNELEEQYEEYVKKPLLSVWEKRVQKKRLTIGAMGHLASFIKIVKHAIDNKYKKILILEADVLFHRDAFLLNFQNRPVDFKLWYLGAGKWNDKLHFFNGNSFYRPNETTGTFAIAFDSSVFNDLLLEWQKFVEPTDVAMWAVSNSHLDDCYVSVPNIAICDVATSLTGSGRSQKAISEKFGWVLDDYILYSVESVNKYFGNVLIEFDFVLPNAEVKLVCQSKCIDLKPNGESICICIDDVLEEIHHRNIFLKGVKEGG